MIRNGAAGPLTCYLVVGFLAALAGGGACAQVNTTSKAPIDVTANEAEVVNSRCVAIWRGDAEALQDQTRLRADTITVFARHKGVDANGQASCGATDHIEAEGHVFYVTPQQNARGDHAVYNSAADEVVITGNVIVVQGENVARGDRLTIKPSTREARMESKTHGAGKVGRVRGVFYPDKTAADAPSATTAKAAQ